MVSVLVAVASLVDVRPMYVVTVCWTRRVCVGRFAIVEVIVEVGTFRNDFVPRVVRQEIDWAATSATSRGSSAAS